MASITLTIPDEKYDEFKEAFLTMNPVPTDPDTELPLYTENQWVKEWLIRLVKKRYKQGREELARQAASYDDDIVN
jgi:hypothetical protein